MFPQTVLTPTLQPDGDLEIHVPKAFDASRPAVRLTKVTIASSINDHQVARNLPHATDGPSIQDLPSSLNALEADEFQPSKLHQIYDTDDPIFSLHITNFEDATLVAMSFPHIIMDGFGSQAILANWTRCLAGKDADVDPVLGTDADALLAAEEACSEAERETWKMGAHCLPTTGFVWTAARLLWDKVKQPPFERKALFLPRRTLDCLVQVTREEAAAKAAKDGITGAFVSEADIVAAFIARAVALSDPGLRPVTIIGALNARFRFPELLPKVGTYVQNMVGATYAIFSARTMQSSVGAIALEHRQSVVEQSSKAQICGLLSRIRADIAANAIPPVFFGSKDSVHIVINNTIKMDLQRMVDFSPAVVRQGEADEKRTNPPGTVKFWYNNWRNSRAPLIGFFYLLGRDFVGKGNYWCTGSLRPSTWKFLEEELASLEQA